MRAQRNRFVRKHKRVEGNAKSYRDWKGRQGKKQSNPRKRDKIRGRTWKTKNKNIKQGGTNRAYEVTVWCPLRVFVPE